MNDSFGGGFNVTSTGGAAQENKAEGVLPLFIKHILTQRSEENSVELFGIQYSIVALVAIVRHIDHSSTKVTYQLEDHTGQIDAHLWLEENDGALHVPGIIAYGYVRVVGSVRNQGDGKAIMIFNIEQVKHPNEVTTHLLEVLNARYKSEEYAKGGKGSRMEGLETEELSSGGFMETDGGNTLGLTGKQVVVYKAIKSNVSEKGITLQELQRKFAHISVSEIKSITDYMIQEGMIYTSVDPEHFICVDA
ncbi:replication protein A 32 kDa subunit [Toxorhynchites rutilus septentrionalis]|uniref:replication protein A 32 kDa subunit n=1 Tax=Toxorhynchites rutilus septentrionalis TaxID=329112 RepID=UPI0024785DE7|nr:replication protein A 32 kDa subunit [Toxorhynchites rutilus septentrionalis]